MGLTKPIITEIAYKTWQINELGCDNFYVLEGTERAAVIDAGMGYCNAREIVESLTDKPYDVLITHAHPDHIGMARQFDRIWINEKEITDARPFHGSKGGWDTYYYLIRPDFDMEEFVWNNRLHRGNWEVWTPDESVINRGTNEPEICYIKEGDTFDLGGGRIISCHLLPGHTVAHMYFIDHGQRIAFTGDCVNYDNGTGFHAASTHIRLLKDFRSRYGVEFDRIFTGHISYCGDLNVKSMPIQIVDNLIEAHRAYLRDECEIMDVPFHLDPSRIFKKLIYGEAPYNVKPNVPPRKWEEGEEHIIP